ncbi:Alpha/Beta hydrolase protein [Zopfochytrium polystomum]|nr:Alpha/Beta hydrolase protein [Zopfochytrium polystomum]
MHRALTVLLLWTALATNSLAQTQTSSEQPTTATSAQNRSNGEQTPPQSTISVPVPSPSFSSSISSDPPPIDARLSIPKPPGYDDAMARTAALVDELVVAKVDDAAQRADGVREFVDGLIGGEDRILELTFGTGWNNQTALEAAAAAGGGDAGAAGNRAGLMRRVAHQRRVAGNISPDAISSAASRITPLSPALRAALSTQITFASAAYCNPSVLSTWSCAACKKLPNTANITVIANPLLGTQALVAVSADLAAVVAAFRGSANAQNWLENLNTAQIDLPLPRDAENDKDDAPDDAKIHSGFLAAWASLRDATRAAIAPLANEHPDLPILFLGHSLGGAIATLAALDAVSAPAGAFPPSRVALATVGEPRVGNAAFAARVATRGFSRAVRAVNYNDLVPHLPPAAAGFRHRPAEAWVDAAGRVVGACEGIGETEDDGCANSTPPWVSTKAHLVFDGVGLGGAAC